MSEEVRIWSTRCGNFIRLENIEGRDFPTEDFAEVITTLCNELAILRERRKQREEELDAIELKKAVSQESSNE